MTKRVYIAGPYETSGDVAINVRNAVLVGIELRDRGFDPEIPHLSHFAHLMRPMAREFWMSWCKVRLQSCDYLLRLPGESKGADEEVELAKEMRIPVFSTVSDLLEHRESPLSL